MEKTTGAETIRAVVRMQYGKAATARSGCGCSPQCCSGTTALDINGAAKVAHALGYARSDTEAVPEGANLGLGCGNPIALASLRIGQTVLDLGSGAGFDVFLAAKAVGQTGRVIGVDMTPEMIAIARRNAVQAGYHNVEFRAGQIEELPVEDGSIDVIISNCVINLSPEKPAVFAEAFRVLKPGGRLAISDIVALRTVPESIMHDMAAYSGCVGGAAVVSEIKEWLHAAGFEQIHVVPKPESTAFIRDWFPGHHFEDYVASATIEAVKPAR